MIGGLGRLGAGYEKGFAYMTEKPDRTCLALNLLAFLIIFLIANIAIAAHAYLHENTRPIQITLVKGPLWPVDLLLGGTFPVLLAIIGVILGAITAFRYHSRWGAATASVLATLILLHMFVTACLGR